MNLNGLGGLQSDRFRALLERLQREQVFPFVTIDFDKSPDYPRLLKHYAGQGLLPAGYRVWKPDFESANFTLDELAGIAANMAAGSGASVKIVGDDISQEMKRTGAAAGTSIERLLSSQKFYGRKGADWGRHLAEWATSQPCPSKIVEDDDRPAITLLRFVLRGQTSDYVSTIESVYVDDCGRLVRRRAKGGKTPPQAWSASN